VVSSDASRTRSWARGLAGSCYPYLSPASREATVTGNGDRQRTVRFTYGTARALDRYLRERVRHHMMARVRSPVLPGGRGAANPASVELAPSA